MLTNPELRKWAYVAQAVIGAGLLVLVAGGLITQEISDSTTATIGGLLGLLLAGNGGLAAKNTRETPTIAKSDVQKIADALARRAADEVSTRANEVGPIVADYLGDVFAEADRRLQRQVRP